MFWLVDVSTFTVFGIFSGLGRVKFGLGLACGPGRVVTCILVEAREVFGFNGLVFCWSLAVGFNDWADRSLMGNDWPCLPLQLPRGHCWPAWTTAQPRLRHPSPSFLLYPPSTIVKHISLLYFWYLL
ncbi:hypothetical protein TSUD_38480 [Trifolium subterraneum]|uniref:Uncharacterized protein n=1 Tax=Trifolium subterraneum TaxID=3900 RepID=A0A2Z6MIV9_TRISU|nr:hypothetical protein TSUD_38480 [Trifolium subterraneum]